MEYEGKIYFALGKHKASYKQLQENPNVEICSTNTDRCWLRLHGEACFDERKEVLDKSLESSSNLQRLYNKETGKTLAIFYIKNAVAEFSDMKGYYEVIYLNLP